MSNKKFDEWAFDQTVKKGGTIFGCKDKSGVNVGFVNTATGEYFSLSDGDKTMIEFEIKDFELGSHKTKVTAQGIAEAMLDYLPWHFLNISILWYPSCAVYEILDLQTDFKYEVTVKQQPTGKG